MTGLFGNLEPVPTEERRKSLERVGLIVKSPTLRVAAFATTDIKGVPISAAVVGPQGETLLDTLISTREQIQPGAQAVHGIRQTQLDGAPTLAQVLPQLEVLVGQEDQDTVFFTPGFMERALIRACELEHLEIFSAANWIDGQTLLAPICGTYNWTRGTWSKLTFAQAIGDLALPGDLAPLGSALGNAQRLWHVLRHHATTQVTELEGEASPCPVCSLDVRTCGCTSTSFDEYFQQGI